MKRFYEDSSQAKTFTKSKSIRAAMKYISESAKLGYELRWYYDKNRQYELLGHYTSRKSAELSKAFLEMQYGKNLAIVYTGKIPNYDIDYDLSCRSL